MTSAALALHRRNTVTYLGLLLGMIAPITVVSGRPGAATAALALAALADTFDGRFARLFVSTPEQQALGGQLDSLADACTFGLAPVLCVLGAVRPETHWTLVVAGFAYLSATVTRLAFFNLTTGSRPGFTGLPAPAGALCLTTAMTFTAGAAPMAVVMLIVAVAMVAPWRIPRPAGLALLAFACWPVALIVVLATRG